MFSRKAHPARASRIATLGLSSTALLTMVASFGINANASAMQEAAANQDVAATPASDNSVPAPKVSSSASTPAITKSASPKAVTQTSTTPKKHVKKVKAAQATSVKVKKTTVKKKTVAVKPTTKKTASAAPTQPVAQPVTPTKQPVAQTCWTPNHHKTKKC